jgi:hypothetical protein
MIAWSSARGGGLSRACPTGENESENDETVARARARARVRDALLPAKLGAIVRSEHALLLDLARHHFLDRAYVADARRQRALSRAPRLEQHHRLLALVLQL